MRFIAILILLTSCKQEILHELTEAQANQAWVTLSERGIEVEKRKSANGWSVSVGSEQAVSGLTVLQELKIPSGLWRETISETSSLVPSKEERQMLREQNLTKALEGTLLSLPGVVDARVHIVLPTSAPHGSGSVLVVAAKPEALSPQQIRDLVAGASGISPELIAVAIVTEAKLKSPPAPLGTNQLPAGMRLMRVELLAVLAITSLALLLVVRAKKLMLRRNRHVDKVTDLAPGLAPGGESNRAADQALQWGTKL